MDNTFVPFFICCKVLLCCPPLILMAQPQGVALQAWTTTLRKHFSQSQQSLTYGSEIPVPLFMSPSEVVMETLTPLNLLFRRS